MSNIIDSIKVSGVTYEIQGSGGGGGNPTVELTQAEYDALVTAGTVSDDTYYIITDAQAGDLTNYYTKTEVDTALGSKADTATTYTKTETDNAITGATSTKQDTLVSGTNIKTINNTSILGSGNIDIQGGGGGKAIEAGRGISITTGETADTVSFDLPISAGTGTGSLIIGDNGGGTSYASVASGGGAIVFPSRKLYGKNYATAESSFAHGNGCSAMTPSCHAEGHNTKCNGGFNSHSEGENTEARGNDSHSEGSNTLAGENYMRTSCHAEGFYTSAMTSYSHAEGYYTKTTNESEHASGKYNVSNTGSTDADKTLFSVGNGTANDARHNAFEIRQNGDIYLSSGGTDIKLQDHLGGGGSSYTAGDGIDITNDVISVTGKVDTTTYNTYTAATDTALASKQTTLTAGTGIDITDNVISATGGGGGGLTEDDELLLATALTDLNDRKIDASEVKSQLGNYQKKGDYVTTDTLNTRLAEYETALDEQNVEEVTAYALNDLNERFGGLKIVKITESEYEALTTKDENTLYVVVADPS